MNKKNWRRHRPLFASPVPKAVREPKIKWKILPIFWKALKRLCMVLGAVVLLSMIVSTIVTYHVVKDASVPPTLPEKMVLFLELEHGFVETQEPPSLTSPFAPRAMNIHKVIDALDEAAMDERVQELVVRYKGGAISLTQVQELRKALARFRDAGKRATIYASSYGEGGGGVPLYYLASAFDEIWVQPMGVVSITGLRAEVPFLRDVLDKIGVKTQFFQRKDYKTAYESLTSSEISPENKEMLLRLIGDFREELRYDIAQSRDLGSQEIDRLVNQGLFIAESAKEFGLVDRVDYADVLVEDVQERVTGARTSEQQIFVPFSNFVQRLQGSDLHPSLVAPGNWNQKGPTVALIHAVGAIMPSAMGAQNIAAADEIAPAILEAAHQDNVKTIILRVDSPGGSPSASETILRAIEVAKSKGKTVIVSMGATAASGGYWISAYADQIFALPSTVTGSIGVVGGKFSLEDMWDNIGVNWDSIQWGSNAGMWSLNKGYDEAEAEQVNAMLDHIYDSFVARVAKGRGKTPAQIDAIAGGRVWSGARAVQIGLVDRLGGLTDAMDYAALQLGAQDRHDLNIIVLPRPKTPFEQFIELLEDQGTFYSRVMATLRSVHDQVMFAQQASPVMAYEPVSVR